mmetsp:Transcript_104738/g.305810  ORF Transcript_104738/g.305810 Transcript_104738/m.305810 type:complete len:652 (+) Transcript_104738:89-2044(+)
MDPFGGLYSGARRLVLALPALQLALHGAAIGQIPPHCSVDLGECDDPSMLQVRNGPDRLSHPATGVTQHIARPRPAPRMKVHEVLKSLQARAHELHSDQSGDKSRWPWAGSLAAAEEMERQDDAAQWIAQGDDRKRFHSETADQVHLTPGGPGEMVVQFTTGNFVGDHQFGRTPPENSSFVRFGRRGEWYRRAFAEVSTYTSFYCPGSDRLFAPAIGEPLLPNATLTKLTNTSGFIPKAISRANASGQTRRRSVSSVFFANDSEAYTVGLQGAGTTNCPYYGNPRAYYQSPFFHTAILKGLVPGQEYWYQIVPGGRFFSFRQPAARGGGDKELRIGVWADVGVTDISIGVSRQLLAAQPDVLLLAADYCYADGYSPIWDRFGQVMEPLLSAVPMLGTVGDHEITIGQEQGKDYLNRYTPPYRHSRSTDPFWYSYDVGLVHLLSVSGSFSDTSSGSPQYQFIQADLESVDRSKTPWIVFMTHIPWYNSNQHHHLEGIQAQADLEWLLYKHGVDLVINGHVHAYERTHPVFNFTLNSCGPRYHTVGDGGNYEGPDAQWLKEREHNYFSAFREASFGAAVLTIHDEHRATWEWRRSACARSVPEEVPGHPHYAADFDAHDCTTSGDDSSSRDVPVDLNTIVRDVSQCPNKASNR